MISGSEQQPKPSQLIKGPQDFAGGVLIVGIAAVAIWLGGDLPVGTLGGMGPGMMPRSAAALLGILGIALILISMFEPSPVLSSWSLRGMAFVLGAILVFAYTVRPLGLAVATPVTILIGAFASSETRWGETLLFSFVMSAFCIGLFKYALGLPVPLAPWLVGY